MTTLQHPTVHPPLLIEVADDRVDSHLAAGWLSVTAQDEEPDHNNTPDPDPTGEDLNPTEENHA